MSEIMRIFKDLNLVEHLGSGVPRILESYSRDCFKFTDNFVRMSFPSSSPVKSFEDEEKFLDGGTIGGAIGGTIEELTSKQNEVLAIIVNYNKVSVRGLAKILGINVSAAQAHIDKLKDKKIIKRVGGTRGYWKYIEKKKP